MDRFGPYRDGAVSGQNYTLPLNLSYTASIRQDHSYTTPFYASPVIAQVNGQNMAFAGSTDGNLFAFGATGAAAWTYKTQGSLVAAPAVTGTGGTQLVVFGSSDGNLYGLNAATGALVWKDPLGASVMDAPVVVGGTTAFVGANNGVVSSLNVATGALNWQVTVGGAYAWAGAAANATDLFVCGVDGSVTDLSVATGATVWTQSFADESFRYSPALSVNKLYVPGLSGTLYALNPGTGAETWTTPLSQGTGGLSSPAFLSRTGQAELCVASADGTVALYQDNGTSVGKLWSVNIGSALYGSPSLSQNLCFVGARGASGATSSLVAIDLANGKVDQSIALPYQVGSSSNIALANETLYLSSDDGYLLAYAASTLTETPSFSATTTPSPTQTPTLTFTATSTATLTETETATPTATATETDTETSTPTVTETDSPTVTPTDTETATPTMTPTSTFSPTLTATSTSTPTDSPSITPTVTGTDTPTSTDTETATQTDTSTSTDTPTVTSTPTPQGIPCWVLGDAVVGAVNSGGATVVLNAGSEVDAYNSNNGPYGGSNVSSQGNVVSAGGITRNGGNVQGSQSTNASLDLPVVPAPQDAMSKGSVVVSTSSPLTLGPGDYLFSNLTVQSEGTLTVSGGLVRIWVSGSLNLSGNVKGITLPCDLQFLVTGGSALNLNSQSAVYALIYAPQAAVSLNSSLYGSVVGSSVTLNTGGAVHLDTACACSTGGLQATNTPVTASPFSTPSATSTPAYSPPPSPTSGPSGVSCSAQLNLQVWNPNEPANQDQLAVTITNWGSGPIALNRLTVRAWIVLGRQGTLQAAAYAYNQQVFLADGTWVTNVAQPQVSFASLGSLLICSQGREADTAVSIAFTDPSDVVLAPNGGYVRTNSGDSLAGWNLTSWANLNRSNDYSSVPAGDSGAGSQINSIYYSLYLDGVLQCEWTSATTPDAASGQQPCGISGTCCNGLQSDVRRAPNGGKLAGTPMPNLSWIKGVLVAPNPASTRVELFANLAQAGAVQFDLYSLTGQRVAQEDLGYQQAGVVSGAMNLNGLADGIYFVMARTTGQDGRMLGTFKLAVVK